MGRSSTIAEAQPLAVQLARERFRQSAMANLLVGMKIDPATISINPGGELCLSFTQRAFEKLQEICPGFSAEESLELVRSDLNRACQAVLQRNVQNDRPFLDIKTERWLLVVSPEKPAWEVYSLRQNNSKLVGNPLVGLPWRLILSDHFEESITTPLPLWFLAQAKVGNAKQQFKVLSLQEPKVPADERAEAVRFQRMRDALPEAMQDLCSAFRLLQWERQRRPRLSWSVTLELLDENDSENGRFNYSIIKGKPDAWEKEQPLALGSGPKDKWVYVSPDPDSPSRWRLQSRTTLPPEVTLFELPDPDYVKQERIAVRLSHSSKTQLEDTALAATQIELPTSAASPPEFHLLPGEEPWEPRQSEALKLALSGHPVCAIKGPPGTGKSTVIVGLIRRAIHAGQRVLLVAPTHVALDEVLGRIHKLRKKNLESKVVPARVAPANEQRAQIKPELEEYIARRLGRNLAQKCVKHIQKLLAALPSAKSLEQSIHLCTEKAGQLRSLVGCRQRVEKTDQKLKETKRTLQAAEKATLDRQTALANVQTTLSAAQESQNILTEAARLFTRIEDEFIRIRRELADTEEIYNRKKAALDAAQFGLAQAEQQQSQAQSALANAHAREEKERPSWGVWEFFFHPHANAVKALEEAKAQLEKTKNLTGVAQEAIAPTKSNLCDAEAAREKARSAAAGLKQELVEMLTPCDTAIAAALKGLSGETPESMQPDNRFIVACQCGQKNRLPFQLIEKNVRCGKCGLPLNNPEDWFSALPDSLRRAVAMYAEFVRSTQQSVEQFEDVLDQAEAAVHSAHTALQTAEKNDKAERTSLLKMENKARASGIDIAKDLASQISETENMQKARTQELERTSRHRELLQRWLAFYEDGDGDEQITNWALTSVNLVAATTQGIAGSKEFKAHDFDLMICDESSRVTRGEILVPADRAARIVLVGDEKQLPPYVEADDEQLIQALATIQLSESRSEALPEMAQRLCDAWNVDEPEFRPVRVDEVSERARTLMAGGSLPVWPDSSTETTMVEERLRVWRNVADALTGSCFDHLLGLLPTERIVRLSVQRRMPAEIATLVSEPVYDGDYQSPDVSPAPLLTPAFRHAWVFFNTRSYCAAKDKYRHAARPEFLENHQGTGFINEGEAQAVVLALKQHVAQARSTGKTVSLMVITFYLAQARLIESLVRGDKELRRERIAILPIDRCQGQEADVVIVSFVRTLPKPRPNAGRWLQDIRRLNVAFTRAKRSLVLIGNLQTLTALRGDAEGEKLLAHLGRCVVEYPDHQIEQLYGL